MSKVYAKLNEVIQKCKLQASWKADKGTTVRSLTVYWSDE